MSNMDVNERKSLEDLLTEYARQAERLREQICEIRRHHIERILKLFEECRRVDRTLTMQTAELKFQFDSIQNQIDQLQRCWHDSSDAGAWESESVAVNEVGHQERERPLSAMLGKLLGYRDKQNGEIAHTINSTSPIGQKSPQKPHAAGCKKVKSLKRRSGPLDSEEVRKVAEMARRLASYQNLPINYPCVHKH